MARVRLRFFFVAVHFALSMAVLAPAYATEQQVAERVFLVRDKPGTPTHFHMIVLAGCADETGGQCRGLAHYLEHLVLGGRNPEHKEIAVRMFPDASSNGWTSSRATAYLHTVPAREAGPKADLETLFKFYAARLRDFSIGEEEAARERNVVLQEHDWRVAASPGRRFAQRLDRELLPDHPAGQWTIGTRDSIQSLTLADAKAFHRTWYAVNNAYFVVRADIDAKDLKEIAARALAGLEPRTLQPRATQRLPAVTVERKDLRETDARVKRANVSYTKLVRVETEGSLTRRAARVVLLNFLRSRLPDSPYQALVETAKVAAPSVPGISLERVAPRTFKFRISADVALDATPEQLLEAIGRFVDTMAKAPPSPEIVTRLKQRLADGYAGELQDPAQVHARLIGWLANRTPYEDFRRWPERIAEVSIADVAGILQALSGPGRVVTGTLLPAAEETAR